MGFKTLKNNKTIATIIKESKKLPKTALLAALIIPFGMIVLCIYVIVKTALKRIKNDR